MAAVSTPSGLFRRQFCETTALGLAWTEAATAHKNADITRSE